MKEVEFLKYAFAENGNKTPVDVERNPQGEVSIRDGYTPPYSNDPQAGGLYITREHFNWIMNYFTQQIQALQINGLNELNQTILTTIGYPKGARCAVWLNIQTCKLDVNGANNPLCVSVPVVSMKDNNQTSPYSQNALFGDWWLDDGCQIGEIKTFQVNLPAPPDGYLDLAPNDVGNTYVKETYPRIKAILGDSNTSKWGFFFSREHDATLFGVQNPRGYFPRVWSNGSSIDSGRVFDTFQSDAIRNITGGYESGRGGYGDGSKNAPFGNNGYAYGAITFGDGSQSGSSADITSKNKNSQIIFKFDASREVPTDDENRPYNFNQKMYIKV